ncbi:MAG TPA: hypothetical protein VN857_12440 [Chthoniobacterales bacterium]|nr:hypothetical protein [Chthoniobacterales bacterium]
MESSGLHHIIAIAADPQRKLDKSPNELGTNLFLSPWMESSYARIEGRLLPGTVLRKGAV